MKSKQNIEEILNRAEKVLIASHMIQCEQSDLESIIKPEKYEDLVKEYGYDVVMSDSYSTLAQLVDDMTCSYAEGMMSLVHLKRRITELSALYDTPEQTERKNERMEQVRAEIEGYECCL